MYTYQLNSYINTDNVFNNLTAAFFKESRDVIKCKSILAVSEDRMHVHQ